MNRLINGLVLAALFLTAPATFAAPDSILVVFNGNTEVNRHVYNFFVQALGNGAGYKVSATLDPSTVKPGQYKAVIVVSTRTTSGIDPAMSAFIGSYPAPKELYLVSLLSRTANLSVTPVTAASNPLKVDGVTAATTWSRGSQTMHSQWMQDVLDALAAR